MGGPGAWGPMHEGAQGHGPQGPMGLKDPGPRGMGLKDPCRKDPGPHAGPHVLQTSPNEKSISRN